MNQPQYKFYATLIDAYAYFLTSESDTAYQEFIDKLNRVPFTSEAAQKGIAFNKLIDELDCTEYEHKDLWQYEGFEFKGKVVDQFVESCRDSGSQCFCTGLLQTSRGLVELYGYIDKVKADTLTDIKTTSNYTFPKYLHNFQHIIYPYCLRQQGIDIPRFRYMVTDFNNYYEEDYVYQEKDVVRLVNICEQLIDFIEMNRAVITDKKLFAEDIKPLENVPAC